MTLRLTESEARVMRLVAAGLTTAEIADALGLSRPTVVWHLARAYRKLGLDPKGDAESSSDLTQNKREVQ